MPKTKRELEQLLEERERELNAIKIRLKALQRADEISRSGFDLPVVLGGFMDLVSEITHSDGAGVVLQDERTEEYSFVVADGDIQDVEGKKVEKGKGLVGWVIKTGVPLCLNDLSSEKRWSKRAKEELGFVPRNALLVPVKIRGMVVGVVVLVNKTEQESYTEEDVEMGLLFCSHLATTVENIRLYRKMEWQLKKLSGLVETSVLLGSTLNIDKLLDMIMEVAKQVTNAEASSIFQIDEETKELYFVIAKGEKGEAVKSIRVPWGKGVVGWVAQTGETVHVPDVYKDERFYKKVDEKSKFTTRSILAVPLKVKDKIIGVAEVLNKIGGGGFTPEDIELFEALAKQAAVAMENARLYQDLDDLFRSSIRAIVYAVEAKDRYTRGHTERVTDYTLLIAREMGLDEAELRDLELAALLHDVGKIGIPDSILGKPGRLTDEEYSVIKQHPVRGAKIMSPLKQLQNVIPGIRHHHEFYNGTGYPDGLKGKEIPLMARIIAVGDAFDAMTTDRPYRKGMPIMKAIGILQKDAGTQFDPVVVDAFVNIANRELSAIEEIVQRQYKVGEED